MAVKILVVDDEEDLEVLIRQKYRRMIRNNELHFLFAHNGLQALDSLRQNHDIDMVLTDINMPEMDGLTLLGHLSDLNPNLKAVVVSAYGDMGNIRTAMNRGAFDFITKPIDFEDLTITINKTAEQITALRKAAAARDKLDVLERELNVASNLQQSILPKKFPPFPDRSEFDIYAGMIPAREVGGDFYDFFMLDDDLLGFVIADVSGKGIAAALFMAVSRTTIKSTALHSDSANECLRHANSLLSQGNETAMFVTAFYGVLNTRTGELQYCNGGHNEPLHIDTKGAVTPLARTNNIALGWMEDSTYSSKSLTLQPGATIFLYTDGVTEATNKDKQLYGEQRLSAMLANAAAAELSTMCDAIVQDVHSFYAGAEQHDDITIMALRYQPN